MASVLVVDDEASIRLTLAEFLRADGHQVAVAENANAALEMLGANHYDVVVSDIIMPRMTGVQLLEAMQRVAPQTKVVLITGEPTFDTAASAVRMGAFDYLAKPVRGGAVCKVVRAAAQLKEVEDDNRRYRARLEALVEERTAQLRVSEERYRRMTDSSLTGICVQRDGSLLFANPRLAEILGCSGADPTAAVGKPLETFLHDTDLEGFLQHCERVLAGGRATSPCLARVVRTDGAAAWIELLPCVIDHGGSPAVMVTVIDVSSRVEAEQRAADLRAQLLQAQKLEAVGRLAGGVAHDFNNMLTVIRGNAELAWSSLPEGHDVRGDLDEIRKAAQRAADLTSQLLAFSRKQMVAPQVLRMEERLEHARRMLGRLIGEDIELSIRTEPGLWHVRIDPTQVDQILANLVTNARDAMPDGGRIVLEACNVTRDHIVDATGELTASEYVVVTATDTGLGMDAATLERIFEPFFTTKGVGKGTGLGLATVYGIVKQNGGAVRVESKVGEGTTIRILLPRSHATAAPVADEDRRAVVSAGTGTILLVEDEEQVRALAQRVLAQHGYQVLSAARPSEAIGLVSGKGEHVDLLLTDVVMPGMGGPALYKALTPERPELRVLYMTGCAENGVGQAGTLERGAPLLQKPFSATQLNSKVRETLGT